MAVVSIPIINVIDIHLATFGDDDLGIALRLVVLMEFAYIDSMEIAGSLPSLLVCDYVDYPI